MKKIWVCPKCVSASKRRSNIRRHGLTVHGEAIAPLAYDPLLQRFSFDEGTTSQHDQDFMPYFFPFNNQGKKMTKAAEPSIIETLTDNFNRIANFQEAFLRADKNMSFSEGHTPVNNALNYFPKLSANLFSRIEFPTIGNFTGYACMRCRKTIIKPWVQWNALTAKAFHEDSCQGTGSSSSTMDSQGVQSLKNLLIQNMNSRAEQMFPSKRYIDCLDANFIEALGTQTISLFTKRVNLVELGTGIGGWALRAVKDKKTEITKEEMKEFIEKASGTFAIFKTNLNNIKGCYYMQIVS